jgi:hypothetical protein
MFVSRVLGKYPTITRSDAQDLRDNIKISGAFIGPWMLACDHYVSTSPLSAVFYNIVFEKLTDGIYRIERYVQVHRLPDKTHYVSELNNADAKKLTGRIPSSELIIPRIDQI